MRLTKENKDEKIVELYKNGWSYKQLQKRYNISPNHLAKLVRGIEVKCAVCGKHKGKVHFRAYHPDRINRPNYTITLCQSCHTKEELKLRRDTQKQSRTLTTNTHRLPNKESDLSTTLSIYPTRPLPKTVKKVFVGGVITLAVKEVLPNFFNDLLRWLQQPDNSRKKPIMGLKRSD